MSRNPETNQTIEDLFVPSELADEWEPLGCGARAYADPGSARRGGTVFWINRLWRASSPVTMRFSNAFSAIAKK